MSKLVGNETKRLNMDKSMISKYMVLKKAIGIKINNVYGSYKHEGHET